jgi:hypothetical protein
VPFKAGVSPRGGMRPLDPWSSIPPWPGDQRGGPGSGIREDESSSSAVPSSESRTYGETSLWVAACPEEDLVATNCVYISRDSLQVDYDLVLLSGTLRTVA